MKKAKMIALSLVCVQNFIHADTTIDGDVRLRYESFTNINDKYYGEKPKVGESDDSYLLTRVILGAKDKVNDNLMIKASLQYSKVFGWGFENTDWYSKEFNQVENPQEDKLDLSETYLQYTNANLAIKTGRQKISYGDTRVFGSGDWKNSGKWMWDAMKISFKKENNFIDAFYGATVLHDPDELSINGKHGYYGGGIYGHYELSKSSAVEPIFAYKKNQNSNQSYLDLHTYYTGIRLYDKNNNNFFYDLTYIQQLGDTTRTNNKTVDIDACAYHLDAGYMIENSGTKIGLGYSFATGDDPKTTTKSETFDGAFGASAIYYGRMNLFSWSNLKDYELFAIFKPIDKVNIKAEYHKFYADQPTSQWKSYTISSMSNDHYGDEIDVVTTYNYQKNIELQLGLSYFESGEFIKEAASKNAFITDSDATGLFAQVQYKF